MPTANEALFDSLVRHQIQLQRFSGSVRNRILKLLDATEADMRDIIERRLANAAPGVTPSNVRRLKVVERMLSNLRTTAWKDVNEAWFEELYALAKEEPVFIDQAVKTTSPVTIQTSIPPPEKLRAIVSARPFEGRVMRDWARQIQREDLSRIISQVRIGMVQGEDSRAIARRVVGSARLRGVDGATQITRRQAEAITRTAVNHISNAARREYFSENSSVFQEEVYTATLDSRTTPVCRGFDGKVFPVGEGPMPPLHFNCRSTRVAVLDGEVLGDRPAKPVTERMLLREYADSNGLRRVTSRDSLPKGHKGTYDQFARKRIRDLTGTVPGKTSYNEWLGRQSAEFQDDVLGTTRARLFRRGGLTLDKFVNRAGDEIPLRELATKQRQAFISAGLDPDSF